MATNADFDDLIERIDTATTTLENSVQAVAEGSADIADAVAEAEAAANTAQQQAVLAGNSAAAAVAASGEAQTHATNAGNAASAAATARDEAQDAVVEAQNIADDLLATAPFQEAPLDGGVYGRQNGEWALVETGGATPVTSVNNEFPDAQGNVTLEIPTKTSELINDSGFITAAEVPPSGIEEAPEDGQQYARKDGEWVVVEAGGGGGAWPAPWEHPQEAGTEITSDGSNWVPWTQWSFANPFKPQPFNALRRTTNPIVNTAAGYNAWFTSAANLATLPAGKYYFNTSAFKNEAGGAGLNGKSGVIYVENYSPLATAKRAWAVTFDGSGTIGGMYVWRTSGGGTWYAVGTQTG